MQLEDALQAVAARIRAMPQVPHRRLIALAGPPASGKSTLAERLAEELPQARVVPMDGFHLDNRLLEARDLLARKGAPETFDVAGFRHLMTRLRTEDEVVFPLFDRSLDRAIAGAGCLTADTRTVLIEGNYLLLDSPGWRDLKSQWDLSVYLSVPQEVLRQRLMERWRGYGFTDAEAARKVEMNDLPNAMTTRAKLVEPDLWVEEIA